MTPLNRSFALLLGGAALTSAASAQALTEVRISTAGTDQEYVEILGTPGQSTDGLLICTVEGDLFGQEGFLDKVYDLSGDNFGAGDQYYTIGSAEAAGAFPNGTFDGPPLGDNLFENSSKTVYLLSVPDLATKANITQNLQGTDIRTAVGATTTIFSTTPGITILDAVAIVDADIGDLTFDGAPVFGPDGNFIPAGVFRTGGCPGDWCSDVFLNFQTDGVPNPPYVEPTPGTQNPVTACATAMSVGMCPGNTGTFGTPYCMANPNITGVVGELIGMGSILVSNNNAALLATNLPPNQFGFCVNSRVSGFATNPGGSNGNLCVGGSVGRFDDPGEIKNTGMGGTFTLDLDLTALPRPNGFEPVLAGETWFFQAWHRENVGGGSNFTRGVEITFQ